MLDQIGLGIVSIMPADGRYRTGGPVLILTVGTFAAARIVKARLAKIGN